MSSLRTPPTTSYSVSALGVPLFVASRTRSTLFIIHPAPLCQPPGAH
jgi:hypothetical protein